MSVTRRKTDTITVKEDSVKLERTNSCWSEVGLDMGQKMGLRLIEAGRIRVTIHI